jgi:hypothetical protein
MFDSTNGTAANLKTGWSKARKEGARGCAVAASAGQVRGGGKHRCRCGSCRRKGIGGPRGKISPWLHSHGIPTNRNQLPDSQRAGLLLSCFLSLSLFQSPDSEPHLFSLPLGSSAHPHLLNSGTEDPKFPLEINSLFPKYST